MRLQRRLWLFTLLIAIATGFPVHLFSQTTPSAVSHIGAIDEASLTTLSGNRHPLATAANDRGEAPPDLPMDRMLLVLRRDPTTEAALQQLLAAQQDKSSPSFHAWLSPDRFAQGFGPTSSDVAKLTAWLTSHGFQVNRIARGASAIEFSGNAAQVQEAFHTSIHSYAVNGKIHYANAADPQIPIALASLVAGVSTLHNFEKISEVRVLGSASRIGNTSTWQPNFTVNGAAGTEHFLTPGDFAVIYNSAPLYKNGIDGSGQSIAIAGRTNINRSDVQIFRLAFGLPVNDPQIIIDGPDPGNFFGGEEAEADLDVEWSGAIAPKAAIKFVVSASTLTTDGIDLSSLYIVDNNIAPIVSVSFGACETTMGSAETSFYNSLWEQAAAQGMTVIVANGDSGAAGCDNPNFGPATRGPAVSGIASTPFNVALGGTQFNENGADSTFWSPTNGPDQSSVLGYIPENVWNESCSDPAQCFFPSLFASGGGVSKLYSKPAWQAGPGVPIGGNRALPDISLAAGAQHDGLLICQDGICLTDGNGQLINAEIVGGTSAAAPAFAGIMALLLQKTNARQGQVNPVLYPLAAAQNANCDASGPPQSSCVFNDITHGDNNVPGQTGATAQVGYDLATGLGSLNAANLVNAWSNITFRGTKTALTLSPSNITHGQPVTASVAVTPSTGTGTPTGGVALLTSSGASLGLGSLDNTGSNSSSVTTLPGGSYSVSASYGGDSVFGSSTSSPPITVTVTPEPSSLSFSASSSAITYSAFLQLNVTVAGASNQGVATGAITFSDSFNGATTTLTTVPLNTQGNLSANETALAVGTHSLAASYSGDSSFQPSSAGPVTVTVSKGPTETFLFAPPGVPPNTQVFLQALVFPTQGTLFPTGTVQFFDGGTALGTPADLKNLVATLLLPQLASGSHTITANYSGDANFTASTARPVIILVGNPDFQIAVNPGNITVSASAPGTSTVLVSPGPGLGYSGPVSFSCSGLPAGASCSIQPPTLNLDGFTPLSTKMTITKSTQGLFLLRLPLLTRFPLEPTKLLGSLASLAAMLLAFLRFRRRPAWSISLCACAFLAALLSFAIGCGGGTGSPLATVTANASNTYVVTVTATGTNAFQPNVTHTVTLSATIQ